MIYTTNHNSMCFAQPMNLLRQFQTAQHQIENDFLVCDQFKVIVGLCANIQHNIGDILIVERGCEMADVTTKEYLKKYIEQYKFDMLWYGVITEELVSYCKDLWESKYETN